MPIRKELDLAINLEAAARVVTTGAELYRQGDVCPTCFVVLSGWIALSVLLDDGSCQILDFALPGAVVGIQSGPGVPMYHSACCLSIVRVVPIARHMLETMIEANPRLAVMLCRQIVADEARAHDHLTNVGLRGAKERIAHLLLEVYVRLCRRLPNQPGETMHLPLSQSQIGQALGLTNVHVSRTLQVLRERQIVDFAKHKLEIIDPGALIATAGIDLDHAPNGRRQLHQIVPALAEPGRGVALPPGWMPMALFDEGGRHAGAASPSSEVRAVYRLRAA